MVSGADKQLVYQRGPELKKQRWGGDSTIGGGDAELHVSLLGLAGRSDGEGGLELGIGWYETHRIGVRHTLEQRRARACVSFSDRCVVLTQEEEGDRQEPFLHS